MEAFREFIERYITLTSNDWMTIQQEFTRKEISKNASQNECVDA